MTILVTIRDWMEGEMGDALCDVQKGTVPWTMIPLQPSSMSML